MKYPSKSLSGRGDNRVEVSAILGSEQQYRDSVPEEVELNYEGKDPGNQLNFRSSASISRRQVGRSNPMMARTAITELGHN